MAGTSGGASFDCCGTWGCEWLFTSEDIVAACVASNEAVFAHKIACLQFLLSLVVCRSCFSLFLIGLGDFKAIFR